MRILHVFDHSLPVQSGYSFRSAAILREQRRLGWETVQITGPKHGPSSASIEGVGEFQFYRTHAEQRLLAGLPVINQLQTVALLRRQLRTVVNREQPDIIHAHSPCLNGLAALGIGKPLVYELRSSWEDAAVSTGTTREGSFRYRISRALETYVLGRADAIVTICEGLRTEALARGVPPERIAVVPNAVDADAFRPLGQSSSSIRERFGLRQRYVLGFIGSFFAWEGLMLLIEALPKIVARRPETRLMLVGGGVQEPALRAAVARLSLDDLVIFAGQVPHEQVDAFYDAIDILVYPRLPMRLTEMVTPLKPLEAMALGKLLIASDVGGHREMVAHGATGLLFKAGDPDALAAAVLRLMEDPALQASLRENGPRYVRMERTWPLVVKRYQQVYAHLLERPGRAAGADELPSSVER